MLMKRTLIAAALLMICAVSARSADSTVMVTNTRPATITNNFAGRLGAGIILGEPIGVSAKYWFNDMLAIDGALGASFDGHGDNDLSLYLHSDVLWHTFKLIKVSKGRLPAYIGAGALVRIRDNRDNQFGLRMPLGLAYQFEDAPLDIFAEIGPAIDIAPGLRGEVTGGIGIRFWF
jgi:hypothetical protein